MLILRLIKESFSFAFSSLMANKLRTFLSLLGITIGIFAIISVFTVIDSLESNIREDLNSLGNDMVYIQKWPWSPPEGEKEYPWWRYLNRPETNAEELEKLQRRANTIGNAFFGFSFNTIAQHDKNKIENANIIASTRAIVDMWNLKIEKGRFFTNYEIKRGTPVVVIGSNIVKNLFPTENPIGQTIKVKNRKFTVIGTYVKKGNDIFGTGMDDAIHMSVMQGGNFVNLKNRRSSYGQFICVEAKEKADKDAFNAEIESIMRSIRKLKPMEDNNFALNKVSVASDQMDSFFKIFNLAGAIIGGFSILVGGFGIANIMFVSVKERTKIIGIQKSIGAKRYFILLQFVFEAIVLSVIGGVLGLVIIFLGTLIVNSSSDFTIYLTLKNIVIGMLISTIIGFVAGFIPALVASKLDPVKAISSV